MSISGVMEIVKRRGGGVREMRVREVPLVRKGGGRRKGIIIIISEGGEGRGGNAIDIAEAEGSDERGGGGE